MISFRNNSCPYCRQPIQRAIRLFFNFEPSFEPNNSHTESLHFDGVFNGDQESIGQARGHANNQNRAASRNGTNNHRLDFEGNPSIEPTIVLRRINEQIQMMSMTISTINQNVARLAVLATTQQPAAQPVPMAVDSNEQSGARSSVGRAANSYRQSEQQSASRLASRSDAAPHVEHTVNLPFPYIRGQTQLQIEIMGGQLHARFVYRSPNRS